MLSWEGDDGFTLSAAGDGEPKLSDDERRLLECMRKSLKTGRSVEFDDAKSADRPESESKTSRDSRSRLPRSNPAANRKRQKPPYGVLLVSGDHTHQPGYAGSLAADKRCKLVGLTDETNITPRRRRLNEQLARRLGIPVLPDLNQALKRDDVHVVSVCAEPKRRGRIIVQAAQAGKHLYLDKPLAGSLADSEAIVRAVQKSDVVSHMWSQVRSDAAVRLREVIRSGRLGELTAIHLDLSFAKGLAGTAQLGKTRRESRSPGQYELFDSKRELSNVGVYPLVTLFWLLGRKVHRVSATTGNYFFKEHQKNNMEDFGQMLLELDGGMTASISVGRTGWRSSRSGGLNRACLIGTKQSAVIDGHRPRIAVFADVEPWTAPERDPADPMGMWGGPKAKRFTRRPKLDWITPSSSARQSDAGYFLDCIEQGRESDVSAIVAAAATEVLLAGYQSSATGQVVDLPLARKS